MSEISFPLGSQSGTETGTPTLQFGPPVVGSEVRLEATAPLVRWEKPGHPTAYFFARGVSLLGGEYIPFPSAHPGPEYVRVQITGPIAAMGTYPPDTMVFIRRDDPLAAHAEVWHE